MAPLGSWKLTYLERKETMLYMEANKLTTVLNKFRLEVAMILSLEEMVAVQRRYKVTTEMTRFLDLIWLLTQLIMLK